MDNRNIESIVDNLFSVLPLFKKKLFHPSKCNEEDDLSPSHLHIMFLLNDVGKVPISEVGKRLNISKPNMTPLIKKLIYKKFIEKVRDDQDRRYVYVEITGKGKAYLHDHKLQVIENFKTKLSKLSEKDLNRLHKSLDELKEIMDILE